MTDNLFHDLPASLSEELVSVLVDNQGVRIERIVSTGQTSPKDFWYDQDEAEWVVVLKGEGHVTYSEGTRHRLKAGDHLLIPAHQKHRVDFTSTDEPTVWLAVFVK